jgi:tetratricopeptide (TPR) repeat protein
MDAASQGLIDLPEPFRSALAGHAPARVCDAEASTPQALYGRALARIAAGREMLARQDLEVALPALGDVCGIELAFLDVRQRAAMVQARDAARLIFQRSEAGSRLSGRALHVLGLAEAKERNTPAAIDHLLAAAAVYRKVQDRLGLSHVRDTLGMVEAARGQVDCALQYYSLSLVDKSILGDRYGMAITLGNIGRLHLRSGRYEDAADCFQCDLDIAQVIGDERGAARMHEDLGRTYLAMGELDRAETELAACIAMAAQRGFTDLIFFAQKDLALLRVRQNRFSEAEHELQLAAQALPAQAEAYLPLLLDEVRGEMLLAKADPRALDVLRPVAQGFEQAELPDQFIPALILLAKACLAQGMKASAEEWLMRGLRIARSDGYGRYLPMMNEMMTSLDLVEGILDEKPRPIGNGPSLPENGYVMRERLGEPGGFGETFRAYDPQRAQIVAFKRLKLDALYDNWQRQRLLASARVELEAASRVRHPGIARVLAIGTDADGTTYIVQEYIAGRPLHDIFAATQSRVKKVLEMIEKIASALGALHEVGVVHRDLKPSNILVNEKDLPVLIDFGIAHICSSKNAKKSDGISGTLAYMAPEQALDKEIDGRADLYALGVIAYEWLGGALPIDPHGKKMAQALRDVAALVPPPLSRLRPEIPMGVEALVMGLLQKDPAQRPFSADEVAETCRRLAGVVKDGDDSVHVPMAGDSTAIPPTIIDGQRPS